MPYVSYHNILQLHIRMHNTQLMQVTKSIEQLPHHFQHFLLFEQRESLLETEERILCVLHDEVDVRLAGIEVVKFNDVFVLGKRKDLYLPGEVGFDLVAVGNCYGFLGEEHLGVLLLN